MVFRFPFDVWVAISQLLTIYEILNLRSTSKILCDIMDQRSIWDCVLRDILSSIPLLPLHRLPSMSSKQLRQRATKIARLENLWNQGILKPKAIARHLCGPGVDSVHLLPGGDWFLLLDGETMGLYETINISQPHVTVSCPSDPLGIDIQVSRSVHDEIRLVMANHCEVPGPSYSEASVYHIDLLVPSIKLLVTVTAPELIEHFSLEGDLLVVSWYNEGSLFLKIQNIYALSGELGTHAVMNIGRTINHRAFFRVLLLSEHLILILDDCGFWLYEVPDLHTTSESEDVYRHAVQVLPLWTFATDEINFLGPRDVSPVIKDGNHQRLTILLGNTIFALGLSQTPDDCEVVSFPSDEDIGIHSVEYCTSMGYRHAIWSKQYRGDLMQIRTCAYSHDSTGDEVVPSGMMRLGYTGGQGPRMRTLPILTKYREVDHLSWDEESGRLCILNQRRGHILVIDLL